MALCGRTSASPLAKLATPPVMAAAAVEADAKCLAAADGFAHAVEPPGYAAQNYQSDQFLHHSAPLVRGPAEEAAYSSSTGAIASASCSNCVGEAPSR